MASATHAFEFGPHAVHLIDPATKASPPKPLLVASPSDAGDYPVVVFLHGFLLFNSFYSELFRHVSSHGFIVVAPQLYRFAGANATDDIVAAAAVVDWLVAGLVPTLPTNIRPNLTRVAVAGHSRGGKVAFALALRYVNTALKLSALIGIDPVDGMEDGKSTPPPILRRAGRCLDLNVPAMVVGSGLGEIPRNPLFPACAPKGVNHQSFFDECPAPAYHLVALKYGHNDMLDDETTGIRGKATYCVCKKGDARRPMRAFVGGVVVAFLKANLEGDAAWLTAVSEHNVVAPVEYSAESLLVTGKDEMIVVN